MGNGVAKLNKCFAGDAGEMSRRRNNIAVQLSDPLDEGLGHSFCYIRPEAITRIQFDNDSTADVVPPFRTISGASISANTSTALTTNLINNNTSLDKASAFESSKLFASIPLQPTLRNSNISARSGPIQRSSYSASGPLERTFTSSPRSGPLPRLSGSSAGPIEGGFMSGPIERGFTSGPLENHPDQQLPKGKPKKPKKWASLKKKISKSFGGTRILNFPEKHNKNHEDIGVLSSGSNSNNNTLSSEESLVDANDRFLEWAHGKAGEDRVHVVISAIPGWVFVGIYDGFNGPDATDFLSTNLYSNVYNELKDLLQNDTSQASSNENTMNSNEVISESKAKHSEVLKALSEGLRKTEESFLNIADRLVMENPELALMGSCVLVMLMKGDDLYLMNVGDSRAVMGQKIDSTNNSRDHEEFNGDKYEDVRKYITFCQLTEDHCTEDKREVERIKREHPDDCCAIMKDRVKGSLRVTRAFGAGFLKQPKWNNALLEMFKIDYIGTSPYITCAPNLYHHTITLRDQFIILSSDGLYQYLTNTEVVHAVELFMCTYPEGDPAQYLVEEVVFRAAKKAGMNFHDLLDIPPGDRRKYHDDVSVIVICLEGRIWRSFL